jgi:glyoxylase-like metal-dependent hydrolase (beta-lactamase superfamily II)
MSEAIVTQHPVGQGGFLTGILRGRGRDIRWIYDCGSLQDQALVREMSTALSTQSEIRLLFVSHLDYDHVSGLDRLLSLTKGVEEVVLPYFGVVEALALWATALEEGTASGTLGTFLQDPVRWLESRDVSRVTFVRNRGDDDRLSEVPGPGGEGEEVGLQWVPLPTLEPSTFEQPVLVANNGSVLRATGLDLDWVLLPYAHDPGAHRLGAFVESLNNEFGGIPPHEIAKHVLHAGGRERLRSCYHQIWKDNNLISLSLYMGPSSRFAGNRPKWEEIRFDLASSWTMLDHPGWLSTGDADLLGERRLAEFFRFFSPVLPAVGVVTAPHHGSVENSSYALYKGVPNLRFVVVPVGRNDYGHPSRVVKRAVEDTGARFFEVRSRPKRRVGVYYRA